MCMLARGTGHQGFVYESAERRETLTRMSKDTDDLLFFCCFVGFFSRHHQVNHILLAADAFVVAQMAIKRATLGWE